MADRPTLDTHSTMTPRELAEWQGRVAPIDHLRIWFECRFGGQRVRFVCECPESFAERARKWAEWMRGELHLSVPEIHTEEVYTIDTTGGSWNERGDNR